MKTSETTKMIFKAMCQFRKQLKQPLKDADNPFFKSKYVPLENIVSVIDDAINGTGLSYTQEVIYTENGSIMTQTIITHESGEYIIIDGSMMKPTKQDPQGIGSTITYGRRYSLSLAFGIASDIDDDGNAGSSGKPVNQTEKAPVNQKPAQKQPTRQIPAQKAPANQTAKSSEKKTPEITTEYVQGLIVKYADKGVPAAFLDNWERRVKDDPEEVYKMMSAYFKQEKEKANNGQNTTA